MLPESKADFPKCLYLDQNKWIDLSRAHQGLHDGVPFIEALATIRAAVKTGKLIVPFSLINGIESMVSGDAGRRKRLAEFIVELSRNRVILPQMAIVEWEVRNALCRLFGRRAQTNIRQLLIAEGFVSALGKVMGIAGLSAEHEVAARALALSPAMSVDMLIAAGDNRTLTDGMRTHEQRIVAFYERQRAEVVTNLTSEQRLGIELATAFSEGQEGVALRAGLKEMGVTLEDFKNRVNTPPAFAAFARGIPTLDVFLTLLLARDRNPDRKVKSNDTRDLVWLSVAVPYSDVVVAEKDWAHHVRAARLDTKYDTLLMTDLRELPAQLMAMGCIA